MIDTPGRRKTRLLLIVILLLYLLLATGYGVINPLFEAPDELHHFFAARHIADTKTLPSIASASYLVRQEAAQPPLYYLLASLLIAPIDTSEAEGQLWSNPTVLTGEPRPINVNTLVHTNEESWPWRGYPLAAHLVRGFSTIIGLGTLLCIFGGGRLLWPESPATALLATALVAFLPQFDFLHGAITNDVLIIFFSSFVIWQLLWLWRNEITTLRLLLLGVSIGLAVLSKMAGLLLLPLALLVLALMAWRDRQTVGEEGNERWMRLLRSSAMVLIPALLICGWLLLRNWNNYSDFTAANQFVAIAGGNRHFSLRQVWHDMDRVAWSAVAFFGWMNLMAPRWVYAIWGGIVLLAGGGWLYAALHRRARPGEYAQRSPEAVLDSRLIALWMGTWVLVVFLGWLRFMIQTPADQGRLMFPALLPAALFVARGLVLWRQPWLSWLAAIAALFTSAYALLVVIPGAYNTATIVTEQQIPSQASRLELDMGYGMQLIAVDPITDEVRPGEWAWVDLYWQAAEAVDEAPFERLGLYGREHALAGWQTNYHGGGNYPASEWPLNQIVKERAGVQLASDARLPVQLRLLLDIERELEPQEIARFKAVPWQWPEPGGKPLAVLGEGIELQTASVSTAETTPGSAVEVDVRWHVTEAPGDQLTTFVHLGDPTQVPLAQGDGPALDGEYPTDVWAAGELIDDRYVLELAGDLPPGRYPVHIGFYETQSGLRLPVRVDGQAQPYDAYLLGWVDVKTAE